MSGSVLATLTSKGQITVPREIREAWHLMAGDQIEFHLDGPERGTIVPLRRRSIFEDLDALELPSMPAPMTNEAIDAAIGDAVVERWRRSKQ